MLQIGQQFRDYIIEREIGQGGMGVVYLVRHVDSDFFDLQGHRVLKVIQSQHLQDPRFQEQFKKEALNGIKLSKHNHPNLVKVLDYFPEQEMSAILMEYVEGLSVGDIQQIRLKQILSVLGPVCKALDFMHSKGTIHRDIKPDNIRLARNRGPVILDLGIAKNLETSSHTTTNAYGSEPFVAPERHDPYIGEASGAIDQYSVGMMVFYWLTGRFPWPENYQSSQVLLMKCRDKLPPLSEIRSDLPMATCSVVDKALSMKPEDRFESCMAFAIALRDSMQGMDLNQSVQLSGVERATQFFGTTSSKPSSRVEPTRPMKTSTRPTRPTRSVKPSPSPSSPSPTKPMASAVGSSASEAVPKTVPLVSSSTTNDAKAVPIFKAGSPSPQSSSKKGLKAVLGLLLLGGLGYGGYAYKDSVEQSEFQSRVDEISAEAKRFGISPGIVPKRLGGRRLSESEVLRFEEAVSGRLERERSERLAKEAERKALAKEAERKALAKEAERKALVASVGKLYRTKRIPSGRFWMGCTSEQSDCDSDESPDHRVKISRAFLMMESEVTQGLYQKVTGKSSSSFSGSNRPVENVSWYDAVNFANALSELEGLEKCYEISGKNVSWSNLDCKGWRLPTEAEWEYAARGGESYKYAGSNSVSDVAWYGYYYEDDRNRTITTEGTKNVCGLSRNGYGLCDMSGNVWEWVWDWKDSYSSSLTVDPRGPTSGSRRVQRGGSWLVDARSVRVSNRRSLDPANAYDGLGFRLCRSP